VRCALDDAFATAADLAGVQMHGTGTPLGDPIEIGALCGVVKACFIIPEASSEHCIGHDGENPTEAIVDFATSGMVCLLRFDKTHCHFCCLRAGMQPPSAAGGHQVAAGPRGGRRRRAGRAAGREVPHRQGRRPAAPPTRRQPARGRRPRLRRLSGTGVRCAAGRPPAGGWRDGRPLPWRQLLRLPGATRCTASALLALIPYSTLEMSI